MKSSLRRTGLPLILTAGLALLAPATGRASYHSFNVTSGSSALVQDYRSADVPPGVYDAEHEDDVVTTDGGSAYFYGGFTHQNIINGTTNSLVQYVFWPASGWYAPYCQQIPVFAGTNMVGYPQIGEGSSCAIKGYWPQFTTNLWTREATRYWQPADGTPHVSYQGEWIKEPVSGNWYHVGTVLYPFTVTGVTGLNGWQEDFTGYAGIYIADYANGYYYSGGQWNEANQISFTPEGPSDCYLINNSAAAESQVANSNLTANAPITLTLTNQPAFPTFDPILVTNYSGSLVSTQLLVQWQVPLPSSPQLSYLVQVFTNSSYTGTPAVSFFDNAPDTRQTLLTIPAGITPYVSLTITDIFYNASSPIQFAATNATPSPATTVAGTVGGLAFQYYEASSGNWSVLPNFSSLTPVYSGAVSFTDPTPRRQRINYGFNYTGFITAPTTGVYAFTLHSGDGSKLIIDGTTVINFDGLHDSTEFMGGGITLAAGQHTFSVQYFKGAANPVNTTAYTDGIGLAWQGPGIPYGDVPSSAYSRTPGGSEPTVTLGTLVGGSTICSSNLSLSATVSANGNTINKVLYYLTDYGSYYFRPSQGADYYLGSNGVAPYTLNVPVYAASTNLVRARVFYNSTNILDSAVVPFISTNMTTATAGTPWQLVGNAPQNYPVGGSIQGGTYTLTGDNLSLMALQLKGDGTIVAHLASLPGTTGGAPDLSPDADGTWLAGIIMRSTTNTTPGTPLADGSTTRETSVFAEGSGGTYYANDLQLGGNSAPNAYSSSVGSQKWFKIQRVGNQFTNSVSSNGTTWTVVNSTNLATVGADCYACLFIYQDPSPNPNLNVATFDNVTITGNVVTPASLTVSPAVTNVYAGQTATLTATAGGTQPYTYQWELDGVSLSGATNATLSLTNVQPAVSGDYTVMMTDGDGNSTNATALLNVLYSTNTSLAQVTLTSPTNGAVFITPAMVSLAASVTTNSHTINAVQFYNGATLVAATTTAPYMGTWTNVPAGTYTVYAQVLFDSGSTNTSAPIVIQAQPLPATPQSLVVTSPATNLIAVSWAASANATGYILTRNGVTVANLAGTAYQDFGVAPSTSYCYSVVATNSLGVSSSSPTNCGSAALSGSALSWDAGSSPVGPQDGSDNWGDTATTWWNGTTNTVWTDGSLAVIGLDAITNETVTLTNNVEVEGIIFGADGSGSGNYTVAADSISLPGGAAITTYGTATISAAVAVGGELVAAGSGALTLSGSGLTSTNVLVEGGTLQVLKVAADCPYVVTNGGTLEIGYSTAGGYANTEMQIYGSGAAATNGFYLAGGQDYDSQGQIQLLGAPTTIRQYGTGYATISIFDINEVGLWCSAAASGSALDPNIEIINGGYGMSFQVDAGANNATGDLTINGPLAAGNLGLYKSGTGSLLLNGAATTANIAVRVLGGSVICGTNNCLGANAAVPISSGASLLLNGSSQTVGALTNSAGGTVNFGGTGTLTVTNASLAGALQMTLNKGAATNSSLLAVTGHPLTLGGSLTVTAGGTNALAAGDSFTLFSASALSGSFASVSLPSLGTSLGWITNNLYINGSISVAVLGVPTVTVSPTLATNYASDVQTFTATASGGTPPYAYQWQFNGTNITGATNATLTLHGLQLASSGLYTVVVPGTSGSGTATARLEVLTVPSGYAVQALAYNPIAFWRLNDAAGSTTAYDLMGNYNGTVSGSGVALGVAGFGNPSGAPGFESTNTAANFTNTATASIQIPAMALNTNALTVTGWIRVTNTQVSSAGLFAEYSGSGSSATRSGLDFGAGNALGFTWKGTAATSALIPPTNQWVFVAWVMTSANGQIFLGTNLTVLHGYTNTATEAVQNFGATTPYLGYYAAATGDRFFGQMQDMAVYNYSLTYLQISNLFAAAQVTPTPPAVTLTNPADSSIYLTTTTTNVILSASVTPNGNTVSAVNFYSGTNLLGSAASAPYTYTWNAGLGNYNVYAQAVYGNSQMNSSLPLLITVSGIATAPTNVIATALATNLVGITWSAGASATGYIISRNGSPIATTPAGATGYADYNVAPGTSYCYSLVATNLHSTSAASPSSCVTTPASGAGELVWNANPAAGSGPQDGGGNWGSGPVNWWNGTTNVIWTDGNKAVFGAGTGAGGTVTITNTVSPAAITILDGGYTLASSGSALLNSSLITAPAGATITAPVTNTAGYLTTAGPGTLVLSGTGLEAVTTIVSSGTLQVLAKNGDSPYVVTNGATLEIGYSTGGGYPNDPMTIYGSGASATAGFYLAGGQTYNVSGGVVVNNAPTTIHQYGSGLASLAIFDVNSTPGLSITAAASGSASDANIQYTSDGYGMVVTTAAGANTATGDFIINGTLNVGAYGLNKEGNGSLLLNGVAATGNAGLVLKSGTVICGATNCIGTNANLNISAGATLNLNGFSQTVTNFNPSPSTYTTLGGNLIMTINTDGSPTSSNSVLTVRGTNSQVLTFGGTLTVTNLGTNTLAPGSTFTLFGNTNYAGSFTTMAFPTLRSGLGWNLANLAVNGSIAVTGTVTATSIPLFTPAAGSYVGAQSVTISSDSGSMIFYTTDGSNPTNSGTRISGASPISGISVPVNTAETIMAYATNSGAAASGVASAAYETIATPTWINAAGGSWATGGNWSNTVVANGINVTANLASLTLTTNTTITLDSTPTVGQLLFADAGNAHGWILTNGTGGPLTLNGGTNVPVITVSNQTATISATLAGANGLVKAGAGTLTLSGIDGYTGGTVVNSGQLVLAGNSGASGTINGTLTVNPGGTVTATVGNALGYAGNWLTNLNINGGTFTTTANSDQGWDLTVNLMGGNLVSSGTGAHFSAGGGWSVNTLATNLTATIAGSLILREGNPNNALVFTVAKGTAGTDLLVGAPISQNAAGYGIVKAGAGSMVLTGTNTYTGLTTVSNGTLEVDGSLSTGSVTVNGGTLDGIGILGGAVTNIGGTLAAGTAAGPGTLTISGPLTVNGGTVAMRITKTGGTAASDLLQGMPSVTYGGTLSVTNVTGDTNVLAAGDTFTLFGASGYAGSFASLNLPVLTTGLYWTNNLAVNGTMAVAGQTETLTYDAGTGGTISGTDPQTVSYGGNGAAVTAVPGTGYSFVNWSDGSTANPRTDPDVTSNLTVTANFAINTCTLAYAAGTNGTLSGTTPQTVNYGASGSPVTAVPNTGYSFVNWSDGSTANPRTDTGVSSNLTVTANFAINTYALTYTAGTNGTVTGTSPQTVNYGGSGTAVTAVPVTGYAFVNWSDSSTANPRTDANVTNNIAVTANFAVITYTLTYLAGTNGTLSGTTPQTVADGTNGTPVTAVPDLGYSFANWSDGGTNNPRTDLEVTSNLTVTANFTVSTFTLTYLAGTNGTISGTTPQTVSYGTNGTAVTAVPNSGYAFATWSDGGTNNPRLDLEVTSNLTVTADFASVVPPVFTTLGSLVDGSFTLGGTGGVGQTYILLTASNLSAPIWIPLATNVTGTNGVFNFTDPGATNGQQFYRLRSP